ncbi:hypothetical protein C458_05284 [Haloferax sp. ATCC BAA-644]|nr:MULTISPECIES: hypothetical protein [unclassified Haloferax]ELZ60286.1 hypothetical protein C460_05225 [Haloferax sp. ATCC BAA-646]ELZ64498.1 hypothetical protein C459_08215 [Haloferax sp. ATCC BAA-645]ELZ69667.1 hypothetical protein C458_05284 [Haloferax sp. ATCC BAA-644]
MSERPGSTAVSSVVRRRLLFRDVLDDFVRFGLELVESVSFPWSTVEKYFVSAARLTASLSPSAVTPLNRASSVWIQ